MIFSRKESPILEVDSATLSGTNITVKTNIFDYGGNNKTLINFNRTGTEKATIKIEYGSTPSLGHSSIISNISLANLNNSLS
jgi:hypothetical protein